jgi:predicted SnoaL-like aldol condensation-catalyzing enzyme
MTQLSERNARIVRDFHDAVFNRYELEAILEHVTVDFIEHKPTIEDGRASLLRYCERLASAKPDRRNTILRLIADDEFVALHGHIVDPHAGVESIAVDIFRMRDGMIAEHWEVVEPVSAGVNGQPAF